MSLAADANAILMDIEGTTTSISFVYDELFPYARTHVADFVEREWGKEPLMDAVESLRAQADADHAAGLEGAVLIPAATAESRDIQKAVVASVLWQMDSDRKTTGLKMLQGQIWVDGYRIGQLKGHLYSDVKPALEVWKSLGKSLYIYSSGSVAAQKLLFGNSVEGDLTPLLSGYFDTTTGPKKESASYGAIAQAIGFPSDEVLFLTDNIDEGRAADGAGFRVAMSVRPGNQELPSTHLAQITSFQDLIEGII